MQPNDKIALASTKSPLTMLDAPGAGVPWVQQLFFRFILRPFVAARSDWQENARGFDAITGKILRECDGVSEADLLKPVLVDPMPGLEDSSRYWSISMALEHLTIVGTQMEALIGELSKGRVPEQKVDIAKVKPLGSMSAQEARLKFESWAQGASERILKISNAKTSSVSKTHPWFGPFNSLQWQWLLTQHQAIHLKQIRNIKKGLRL